MELILAVVCGIGLSAACGFRVFVPLLVTSIGLHLKMLSVGSGFSWLGSDWALVCFGVATVVEIAAYYVPWLDHALDTVATPAAVVAGAVLTMAQLQGVSGASSTGMHWVISAILGGGAALFVQLGTVVLRVASTATTGGIGNPVFSTVEHLLAAIVALLAILVPIALVACVGGGVWYWVRRSRRKAARVRVAPALGGGIGRAGVQAA
jgi:hypothetical protein